MDHSEIAEYFAGLPRDVTLLIGDSAFPANRSVLSFFSPVLSSLLSSGHPSISMSIADPCSLFGSVISFLHGSSITITSGNALPLSAFASSLEISSLHRALQPELTRPTGLTNIIPRLLQSDFPPLRPFLMSNISRISADPAAFTLPLPILAEAITAPDAQWPSAAARYSFAFRAADRLPPLIPFFTRDFLEATAVDPGFTPRIPFLGAAALRTALEEMRAKSARLDIAIGRYVARPTV
jgi:hypothetical protein